MSQEKPQGEKPHGAQVITASKGGAGKWLLGAAAAAVVLGGGYYAWSTSKAPQPSTELAYNQTSTGEPVHAAPLTPDQNTEQSSTADSAAPYESGAPAVSTERQTASNTTVRRSQTVRADADAVPEETVGIIPVSATVPDNEESIVVHGARRPVWTRAPSAYRLSTVYPERALETGREGEASVRCMVRNSGALDCVPVSEFPVHAGFGSAALRVAHMFRHAPERADGSPAAGSPVNLHVVFRMADNDRRG